MASHATISAYRGGLEDWPSVARLAAQNKAIEGLAPYVEGEGMVKVGTDLSGTMLRGVLPEEENKVSDIDAHITAGRFDSLQAGRSEARRVGKECVSPCRPRWSP